LPEVLRLDVPEDARRPLIRPRAELDPATTAEVERRVASARAEAYAEGERAGHAAARAQLDVVAAAVGRLREELVAQRAEATRASLALAEAVAIAVLDATPPTEALELLNRVAEAAEALDDDPIVVHLNPADHTVLAEAPLADRRLQLQADARVAAGEARLAGRYSGVELTRQALLAAAMDLLGEGAV
jgi:flagellar biosynthesis/type III secretory pathway protein FliH